MKRILSFALTLTLLLSLCVINVSAVGGNISYIGAANATDKHIQMHTSEMASSDTTAATVAFRTVVTGTWYAVAPYVGAYTADGSELAISVYAWNESYTKTLEGTALRTGTVNDLNLSLGTSGYAVLEFETPLEAGDYLVVYSGTKAAGWDIATYLELGATTGVWVWKDGVRVEDRNVMTQIYVEGAAGAGFQRSPLSDKVIPTLESANLEFNAVTAKGNISWGYGSGQWPSSVTGVDVTGKTAAIRTAFTQTVSAFYLDVACGGGGTAGFLLSVYEWDSNYETTVGSDALKQWLVSGAINGTWLEVVFDEALPVGEYLFVMSDFYNTSGASVSLFGATYDDTKACVSYVDGVESVAFDFFARYQAAALDAVATASMLVPLSSADAPASSTKVKLYTKFAQKQTNLKTKDAAIRVITDGNYLGLNVYVASGDKTATHGFLATTYAWDTDYATTVAGTPVDQVRVEYIGSPVYTNVIFQNALPAGDYLTVFSDPYGPSATVSVCGGCTASNNFETQAFAGGELLTTYMNANVYVESGKSVVTLPESVKYEGYQTSEAVDGKYNVRFIASGSNFDVDAVGFKVTANVDGKAWDMNSNTVYTSILAEGLGEVKASAYGAQYLSTLTVKGVPADTQIVFTVTPYVISEYGTVVYGTPTEVTVG
ncbi:MAG: hypothetical protein E7620_03600 [Ruminococcaceae bacterium]|nr:hypothetical protein [Oscillospiraceae bacterium]